MSVKRVFIGISCVVLVASGLRAQHAVASVESSMTTTATAHAVLEKPVSLHLDRVSIKDAIEQVAVAARIRVQYQEELLRPVTRKISLRVTQTTVGQAMASILSGTALRVVPVSSDLITIKATPAGVISTDGTVLGKVASGKTGASISGAKIQVDGVAVEAESDAEGRFRILLAPGEYQVTVRALGFIRKQVSVTVAEGKEILLEIQLEPSASVLDEVVVTGTVVATARKAIPNPITVITAEDIERRGIARIEELFRGEIPGVLVQDLGSYVYTDTLGSMVSSKILARGPSGVGNSVNRGGRNNPLKTYIDGVEMLESSFLGTIDPQSIERIEIITGPQAATIYGSGAMGGVMQIFTKKGSMGRPLEMTTRFRVGILENNISTGLTPTHNHTATLSGGSSPSLSYSGTVSYRYSGQWQPGLFTRNVGTSFGAHHMNGALRLAASASFTTGRNGTNSYVFTDKALYKAKSESGEWRRSSGQTFASRRIGTNDGQTYSLNIDLGRFDFIQHHVTIGRSQLASSMLPMRPNFTDHRDTLFHHENSSGHRTTLNYSATIVPQMTGIFSSNFVVGVDGADATQVNTSGCTATAAAASFVGCSTSTGPNVTRSMSTSSWGGFGRVQLGLFGNIYITGGLRAERNPAYGSEHKIDWTPSNGATVVKDFGDLTVKLLGSYGRATKAPTEDMRRSVTTQVVGALIPQYVSRLESPGLTPEYSRGPQGGIEIYYGNRGYLTVNRYRQVISDLIQQIPVDSIVLPYTGFSRTVPVYQYVNLAEVKTHGWELTGSANIRVLSIKGTYSWTDARITKVNEGAVDWRGIKTGYYPGASFKQTPTHAGNITVQYASRGTTVLLGANYVGASLHRHDHEAYNNSYYDRLQVYIVQKSWDDEGSNRRSGYAKFFSNAQHRLVDWCSLTLDISDIGNSMGSEGYLVDPTIGRTTWLGVSMRLPRR